MLDTHMHASFPLKNTTQLDLVSSTTQSRFQGTAEALQAIQDDTNEINNGTLSNAG